MMPSSRTCGIQDGATMFILVDGLVRALMSHKCIRIKIIDDAIASLRMYASPPNLNRNTTVFLFI
jgi:hypothetical protein